MGISDDYNNDYNDDFEDSDDIDSSSAGYDDDDDSLEQLALLTGFQDINSSMSTNSTNNNNNYSSSNNNSGSSGGEGLSTDSEAYAPNNEATFGMSLSLPADNVNGGIEENKLAGWNDGEKNDKDESSIILFPSCTTYTNCKINSTRLEAVKEGSQEAVANNNDSLDRAMENIDIIGEVKDQEKDEKHHKQQKTSKQRNQKRQKNKQNPHKTDLAEKEGNEKANRIFPQADRSETVEIVETRQREMAGFKLLFDDLSLQSPLDIETPHVNYTFNNDTMIMTPGSIFSHNSTIASSNATPKSVKSTKSATSHGGVACNGSNGMIMMNSNTINNGCISSMSSLSSVGSSSSVSMENRSHKSNNTSSGSNSSNTRDTNMGGGDHLRIIGNANPDSSSMSLGDPDYRDYSISMGDRMNESNIGSMSTMSSSSSSSLSFIGNCNKWKESDFSYFPTKHQLQNLVGVGMSGAVTKAFHIPSCTVCAIKVELI